jgi:molybdopterin molybdotransferase
MLVAAAERLGAEALQLGIARDDRDELRRWIEQCLAADVLVLSGGVSAGKFDLVPEVLAELGVERVFHKVALRPGKPLWFGVKRGDERNVLVFGLPGNPMSSFVCFELFVRPALAALAGQGFTGAPTITARLTHAYDHAGGRAACLPARVTATSEVGSMPPQHPQPAGELALPSSAGLAVEILPWHGSADLATVAHANGLACLPVEKQTFAIGAPLTVILI